MRTTAVVASEEVSTLRTQCKTVWLEAYTSVLGIDRKRLEGFYGREIMLADRNVVESEERLLRTRTFAPLPVDSSRYGLATRLVVCTRLIMRTASMLQRRSTTSHCWWCAHSPRSAGPPTRPERDGNRRVMYYAWLHVYVVSQLCVVRQVGDPFCATTHTDFLIRARQAGIRVQVSLRQPTSCSMQPTPCTLRQSSWNLRARSPTCAALPWLLSMLSAVWRAGRPA
jgi:hypothetical protein